MKGDELLVKFIEKVGVDDIQSLGIQDRNGTFLVCDTNIGIEKMSPKKVCEKYVITKTGIKINTQR